MKTRRDFSDCSVYCFTETWFDPLTPDSAVLHSRYRLYRADRSPELSGISKGGGVCFMINQRWCNDSSILSTSCSPELETLIIKCKPFYLPREFTSIVMVGVYIPPQANATAAIGALADQITTVENTNPDLLVLILGDFNHTTLSKQLSKYRQQITCATREGKTLDLCYSTIREAYHAIPRAPLGFSDHAMIYPLPSYRQKLKRSKYQALGRRVHPASPRKSSMYGLGFF